ncbi:nucleotidyl transferase AbiEii/AbiGii toxin family protein [Thiorhodovibrio winogradskyi]|uniref:nucleotidyl transferase AbiEii/AbiGii toxin family protein n=2 Tax=Thiorhodovibrio TaxID=61593 RepID=UPI001912EB02|nr:nucleotidyl transferase AbiEii/AbiGii toxin family protein [Thiorhodovibrio winogradskyi]
MQALVVLGIANSRMKDSFDLWVLSWHSTFDGATLTGAIDATFARRATPIPADVPFGLRTAFALDNQKQTQ